MTARRLYREPVFKGTAFEVVHDASPLRWWDILLEEGVQSPAKTELVRLCEVINGCSGRASLIENSLVQLQASAVDPIANSRVPGRRGSVISNLRLDSLSA